MPVECICKIQLGSTVVYTIGLRSDLDGDAGVGDRTVTPGFFLGFTRLDSQVLNMRCVGGRYRPQVDIVRTVVGDNSLGLGEHDKCAEGERIADHGHGR